MSYPPDRFEPALLRRMQSGHILAYLSGTEQDGSRLLSLEDQSGHVVFSERIGQRDELRSETPPVHG